MKAENFIKEILMGDLGASYVVVGEDNRFGFERKGTPRLLMEFGEKYGFDVEILSKEMDGHRKISSTYIREELKKGNMEKVTSLMGRDYFVEGKVVHGRGMGHKVLLPTTNLVPPRTKILPPNGVYVTSSYFGDKIYHGITNIVIAAGDVAGAVGLLTEDRTATPDEAQCKAVSVAAAFLAKQMEE